MWSKGMRESYLLKPVHTRVGDPKPSGIRMDQDTLRAWSDGYIFCRHFERAHSAVRDTEIWSLKKTSEGRWYSDTILYCRLSHSYGCTPSRVRGRTEACISVSCGLHTNGSVFTGSSKPIYSIALRDVARSIPIRFWAAPRNPCPDSTLSNGAP